MKSKLVWLFWGLFFSAAAAARATHRASSSECLARPGVSLNGDWHYVVDPYDEGVRRRYFLNLSPAASTGWLSTTSPLRPRCTFLAPGTHSAPNCCCTRGPSGKGNPSHTTRGPAGAAKFRCGKASLGLRPALRRKSGANSRR